MEAARQSSLPGVSAPAPMKRPRLDWATLHARTWGTDVWRCPCGGRRKVVAVVTSRRPASPCPEQTLRRRTQPHARAPRSSRQARRVIRIGATPYRASQDLHSIDEENPPTSRLQRIRRGGCRNNFTDHSWLASCALFDASSLSSSSVVRCVVLGCFKTKKTRSKGCLCSRGQFIAFRNFEVTFRAEPIVFGVARDRQCRLCWM